MVKQVGIGMIGIVMIGIGRHQDWWYQFLCPNKDCMINSSDVLILAWLSAMIVNAQRGTAGSHPYGGGIHSHARTARSLARSLSRCYHNKQKHCRGWMKINHQSLVVKVNVTFLHSSSSSSSSSFWWGVLAPTVVSVTFLRKRTKTRIVFQVLKMRKTWCIVYQLFYRR